MSIDLRHCIQKSIQIYRGWSYGCVVVVDANAGTTSTGGGRRASAASPATRTSTSAPSVCKLLSFLPILLDHFCICILIHSVTQKLLLQCASISRRRRLQRVRACRVASSRSARSMATDGAGQHELMQGEAEAVMAGGYKAEPCLSPSSFLCAHACSALVCDCVVQPRPATSDLMSPFVWERKALAPNHAPRPLPCQRMSSCFTPLISFCMPEARCLSLSRLALCLLCGMVWPSACISMCDP
jgi:hypothetical protein